MQNPTPINYDAQDCIHLHLRQSDHRQKGLGSMMVLKSVKHFFKHLKLKRIICEPYALNPAPNKTLQKLGFSFEKKHRCIPGTLNFEQEVNRYCLTRSQFDTWGEV
ncbi:MAG: GNAT family N-acetyltransferase [Bacteroidetes bacterium]|nr:GNAT family N-acetyltransferase [Bacteroidota bacterium]